MSIPQTIATAGATWYSHNPYAPVCAASAAAFDDDATPMEQVAPPQPQPVPVAMPMPRYTHVAPVRRAAPTGRLPCAQAQPHPRNGDPIAYPWAEHFAYLSLNEMEPWVSRGAGVRRFCQRLRIGQIPYGWSAEQVATLLQLETGVEVADAVVHMERGRPSGLVMVWVAPEDAAAVCLRDRTFLCDLHGAWTFANGDEWALASAMISDGFYRERVAKWPATIELAVLSDAHYDC